MRETVSQCGQQWIESAAVSLCWTAESESACTGSRASILPPGVSVSVV